jgi:hypothetical protein
MDCINTLPNVYDIKLNYIKIGTKQYFFPIFVITMLYLFEHPLPL